MARKSYSDEFKREAVRLADTNGPTRAARDLGIHVTLITSCPQDQTLPGLRPFERGADHEKLDVLVCEGVLGVAESGAVWPPESRMGDRAAPFLAEHLALVLARRALVFNLHEAYARLSVADEGFGVFIAGPSKTADIEQSLVIGAHGPRSLTVFLCR